MDAYHASKVASRSHESLNTVVHKPRQLSGEPAHVKPCVMNRMNMTDHSAYPKVSLLVLAYDLEPYVREACTAALAQDYPNLEILFTDDNSSDGTFEVMCEIAAGYHGPHTIRLNRNPSNLGVVEHVNRAMELTSGDILIMASGDDVSLPNRVSIIASSFAAEGSAPLLVHSAAEAIDAHGEPAAPWEPAPLARGGLSLAEIATSNSLYLGATGAWSRQLWHRFGPLRARYAYEDLCIGFRAALIGDIAYIDAPLVRYRVGVGMSTRPIDTRGMLAKVRRLHHLRRWELDITTQRLLDTTSEIEHHGRNELRPIQTLLLRHFLKLRGRAAIYGITRRTPAGSCGLWVRIGMTIQGSFSEIADIGGRHIKKYWIKRNGRAPQPDSAR